MVKILVPASGLADWKNLLADPEKQWREGYSAMATAQSWQSADGLPLEIRDVFGINAELLFAIPEHKVALPGGGRESQCDVFALVKREDALIAVAVEAKVSEPFGPTVGDWLVDASPGKVQRLTFICDALGVAYPPPGDMRYQLFHRTVAAVVEADRFNADEAAMVVQSFSQQRHWFEDFAHFCTLFGKVADSDRSAKAVLPNGKPLTLAWASGSPAFLSAS